MLRPPGVLLAGCLGLAATAAASAPSQASQCVVMITAETAPGQFQQGSGMVVAPGFA